MKKKIYNFAIIGCGRISRKHVDAVNMNTRSHLIAVSDLKDYRLKSFTDKNICDTYKDYKKLLERDDVDIVTIATESGNHEEVAIDACLAGKHVILEKPMALSIKGAKSIIQSAKDNNVKLAVCFQNRFNTAIQRLRKALEKNRFGKLIMGNAAIRWFRGQDYYNQDNWRGTWEEDGGAFMNQSIHNIDLLQWMMGPVKSVFAYSDTFLKNIEAEDAGVVALKFKNGAIGTIDTSMNVYPQNLEETLGLFGEKGTAVVGGLAVNRITKWRFADNLDTEFDILKVQEDDPSSVYGFGHLKLFDNMIDSVENDAEPYIDGEKGFKALELVLAIYKSIKTKKEVKLPLDDFSTIDMIE